jgi:hypothetical protein
MLERVDIVADVLDSMPIRLELAEIGEELGNPSITPL